MSAYYTGILASGWAIPGNFVPAALGPIITGCYLQAPQGFQPWNIASSYQVVSWDNETMPSPGFTNPPPANTAVLAATVNMTSYTLKVWMPASQVQPLG
jgi:hypothetical protein